MLARRAIALGVGLLVLILLVIGAKGCLDARKNRFRQARLIGVGTLVLGMLGRLSLADMEQRASKAFGFRCRVLEWPWAEAAMDADNSEQFELLDIDLRSR